MEPGKQAEGAAAPAPGKGRRKLLVLAAPVLLGGAGAGLWFSGLLGGGEAHEQARHAAAPPVFLDMPEVIANLNTGGRRASYIKLRSKLELARAADAGAAQAAMPRLLDLFATYLREMRPEELRGSAGTQRLREELIARANIAVAPARVNDVLFTEILLQ